MKNKLLWISMFVPYDTVPHAGGKIHNYYLKALNKANIFDIKLLSTYKESELEKIDLDQYGIDYDLIIREENCINLSLKFINAFYRICPFSSQMDYISKNTTDKIVSRLREYKKNGYNPQIIVLQWTQIVLLYRKIKRLFPNSKIVAIEEDVSYLSIERKLQESYNFISRIFFGIEYQRLKRVELFALNHVDLIINNNEKDKHLIEKKVQTDIWVWSPYFDSYIDVNRGKCTNDILFYGAMNRQENWKSALWFIDNVLPELKKTRFVIVGNRPAKVLLSRASEKVIVKGFVEDVTPFFRESLCLVAPLVLGAGVKIKIIEGLSSGIPVLTNKIGIEGIEAVDGREFFFCEEPKDYIRVIKDLIGGKIDCSQIEKNEKNFILTHYNYKTDAKTFAIKLQGLLKARNEDNNDA